MPDSINNVLATMLNWIRRYAAGAGVCLCAVRALAEVSPAPDYRLGDLVAADIVTPVRLVVTDSERTADLRQREAQKVPAIFRHNTNVIDEVEADFRHDLAVLREEFQVAAAQQFQRFPLNAAVVATPRFDRFLGTFKSQNKSPLLTTNLAVLWARGESDEILQAEWIALLRGTMNAFLRVDPLPPLWRSGPQSVRLLALNSSNAAPDLALAESFPPSVNRSNILQFSRVRQEFQARFPTNLQAFARHLAGFLKPNCIFEEDLTRFSRDRRTEGILATTVFEPGQVLVRRGQTVDEKSLAVLAQLNAATAADRAKANAAREKLRTRETARQVHREAVQAHARAQAASERLWWLTIALAVFGIGGSALTILLYRRFRQRRNLLPARVVEGPGGLTVIACPACSEHVVLPMETHSESWANRVQAADQQATKARVLLRAGVVAHLAEWLKRPLLLGLVNQRRQLLDTQQQARAEIEALESRLARIQAPLAERLQAYEARIADLERQLAARDAENRELIEAQIALAKQKLADAQARGPGTWN